mgnify:CR=1 FL=1
MIKILQWGMDAESHIGGITAYLMNQFRCIQSYDIQYDFIHIKDEPMAFQDEIKKQSEIFFLPERRKHPFRYYIELFFLFHKLSKRNYQGIVVNMGGLSHAAQLLLAKWGGIPVRVAHSHTSSAETSMGYGRRLLYWFNRKIVLYSATELWACSKSAGKYLFHVDNAKVIHNGIDTDRYVYDLDVRNRKRKELGLDDAFVLGHVGRFSPVKNHLFLLDIFRLFHEQHPNSILLLVGDDKDLDAYDGYVRNIKEYVRQHHLEQNVIFTGFSSDTSEFYQVMDVFVLPSFSEGFSLVSVEAQTSNLPCIVSKGVPKDVALTENIQYISLEEKSKWINAINEVFKKGNERKSNKVQLINSGYDIHVTMQTLARYWKEMARDHA